MKLSSLQRFAALVLVAAAGSPAHLRAGAAPVTENPVALSAEHRAAVERPRRIFFQYDPGDLKRKGGFGSDMKAVMDYVYDFASRPGSQIDALCIDISNEGVVYYRSKILREIAHPGLMKWREEGLDFFAHLTAEGRRRGKEVWWGLRMNEIERGDLVGYDPAASYADYTQRNPVKAAHPDWLIRSWWWQGFWNYAHPEVRAYRLAVIREVVDQYDFDGVHLDFLRHTPHLPPGRQWELREHLTRFLTDVRALLQARAAARGRPFLLAARVPDSVEGCRTDGLDIATWARRGLVDVLVLGTRTINIDVASFRAAVAGAPVKLLPSFDSFHATDGYHGVQSMDLLRGVFGNYLHQGADGVGIFNNPAGSPEKARAFGLVMNTSFDPEIVTTVGSLATIGGKPRYYPLDRRGGYAHVEGYGSANYNAPLPVTLRHDGSSAALTLPIWEPIGADAKATLRVVLFQHAEADEVRASLNGSALIRQTVDTGWKDDRLFAPALQPETVTPGALNRNLDTQRLTRVEFPVPASVLRTGRNHLELSVDRRGPFPASRAVRVEKVELHMK
jgi:hypothetical protein